MGSYRCETCGYRLHIDESEHSGPRYHENCGGLMAPLSREDAFTFEHDYDNDDDEDFDA